MVIRIIAYIIGFTIIYFCVKTLRQPDDLSSVMQQIAPASHQHSTDQNHRVDEQDQQLKSIFSLH